MPTPVCLAKISSTSNVANPNRFRYCEVYPTQSDNAQMDRAFFSFCLSFLKTTTIPSARSRCEVRRIVHRDRKDAGHRPTPHRVRIAVAERYVASFLLPTGRVATSTSLIDGEWVGSEGYLRPHRRRAQLCTCRPTQLLAPQARNPPLLPLHRNRHWTQIRLHGWIMDRMGY